jgi:hypothetical protein
MRSLLTNLLNAAAALVVGSFLCVVKGGSLTGQFTWCATLFGGAFALTGFFYGRRFWRWLYVHLRWFW